MQIKEKRLGNRKSNGNLYSKGKRKWISAGISGKLYRSPKVLAKELGLPYGSFTHFLQRCDSVEAAVERCREQQESKVTLWGREYASRYELTESMGISYNAVAFAMNVKKVTLEEAIKTLLIKEAIRFEGKEYPTLVDLCTEYGVQASIVMERLQRGKTFYEAIYTPVKNNGIVNEIEYEGITYQNAASLCREYQISRTLVDGQKRYETGRSFLECFHLLRKLRDECGWPKDQTFSLFTLSNTTSIFPKFCSIRRSASTAFSSK